MTGTVAPHQDPRLVGLVALGGAVGTGARHLVNGAVVAQDGWPIATFGVNVLGAFVLGLVLQLLVPSGESAESTRTQRLRLGLGTGLLGGFTTFSSVAIELERMLAAGALAVAATYALATLVCGIAAAAVGVVLGAHRRRRAAP